MAAPRSVCVLLRTPPEAGLGYRSAMAGGDGEGAEASSGFLTTDERRGPRSAGAARSYRRNMSVFNEGDTTGRVVVITNGG